MRSFPSAPAQFRVKSTLWLSDQDMPDLGSSRPSLRLHWVAVPRDMEQTICGGCPGQLPDSVPVPHMVTAPQCRCWEGYLKIPCCVLASYPHVSDLPSPRSCWCIPLDRGPGRDAKSWVTWWSHTGGQVHSRWPQILSQEGVPHSDGNFRKLFVQVLNLELADTLGNLVEQV